MSLVTWPARPQERTKPPSTWYGRHIKKYNQVSKKQAEVVLLGDSLVANLSRYPSVWDHHLANFNIVNCGIGGDHTQNVLWRVEHMYLPATVSVGVIHCGINDINGSANKAYKPHDIANNVISCGLKLRERNPLISIIIVGILPTDDTTWRRCRIEEVNSILEASCSSYDFLFIEQDGCWSGSSGKINESLFWRDHLHLNKKGCNLLASQYAKAITNAKKNTL